MKSHEKWYFVTLKLYKILGSVFINKTSLEQSDNHSLYIVPGSFYITTVIIERLWHRSYDLQRLNIYHQVVYRESWPNPDAEHQTLFELLPMLVSSFQSEIYLLFWDNAVVINVFLVSRQNLAPCRCYQQGWLWWSDSLLSIAKFTEFESWCCPAPVVYPSISYFNFLCLPDLYLRIVKSMQIFLYDFLELHNSSYRKVCLSFCYYFSLRYYWKYIKYMRKIFQDHYFSMFNAYMLPFQTLLT